MLSKPVAQSTFDCASVTSISQAECLALVALYNSTDGARWNGTTPAFRWLQDNDPCWWQGVTCSYQTTPARVAELKLEQTLSGTLPVELGNLTNLRVLSLRFIQYRVPAALVGNIPASLSNLTNLERLHVQQAQFNSSIPASLGNLSNLRSLELDGNRLNGAIPAELGNLTQLITLTLGGNSFSGGIPSQLGNLTNLKRLQISSAQLTGPIPPELGNLSNLEHLALSQNQLSGLIPGQLGNLSRLQNLYLFGNSLSGSIPSTLGGLTNLQDLALSNNDLTGQLPAQLANLTNLESLSVYDNQLSGPIPSWLGSLSKLRRLSLGQNQFSGNIPEALSGLGQLLGLDLSNNLLSGPVPIALANLGNQVSGDFVFFPTDIDVSNNQLSGPLPSELASTRNLGKLDVSGNRLSGALPLSLASVVDMTTFNFVGTGLCIPNDAAFQVWLATVRNVASTGRTCGVPSGQIGGRVTSGAGVPIADIAVSAYQKVGGNTWQLIKGTTTGIGGTYVLTDLPQVNMAIRFFDPSGVYATQYYDNASSISSAKLISTTTTTSNVSASLKGGLPSNTVIDSLSASASSNPNTGQIILSMPRPSRSDITITRVVTCTDSSTPTNVTLVLVTSGNYTGPSSTGNKKYPMTPVGSSRYQGTIPAADVDNRLPMVIEYTCGATTLYFFLGEIVLYDPSGIITDAATGQPIKNARVTLYQIAGWFPRLDASDNAPNTCESNNSKTAGVPWSQPAPTNLGAAYNPDTPVASPQVNPQFTNAQGRYGWDVATGCWYVVVSAPGYTTKVSPVVGVPPEVTDLDIKLEKAQQTQTKVSIPIVMRGQ
jgi:Leucine-rich repeat (LRR) protein